MQRGPLPILLLSVSLLAAAAASPRTTTAASPALAQSAGRDGTIHVTPWQSQTSENSLPIDTVDAKRDTDSMASRVLKGHSGQVWSVAFLPDGQKLLSGGADGTVRVWNLFHRKSHDSKLPFINRMTASYHSSLYAQL